MKIFFLRALFVNLVVFGLFPVASSEAEWRVSAGSEEVSELSFLLWAFRMRRSARVARRSTQQETEEERNFLSLYPYTIEMLLLSRKTSHTRPRIPFDRLNLELGLSTWQQNDFYDVESYTSKHNCPNDGYFSGKGVRKEGGKSPRPRQQLTNDMQVQWSPLNMDTA